MDEKTAFEQLKGQVRGDVIVPGDARYDEARKVYNAMIDKRPAAIVRCTGVADVIAAVKTASMFGMPISVRGGGASGPRVGTAGGGPVHDPRRMRRVPVAPP